MNTILMMKKVRFSVAMAVIAVAMVSCGNGPQQKIEVPEVRLRNLERLPTLKPVRLRQEIRSMTLNISP